MADQPAAVDLLRAFVNTRELETGIDAVGTPDALAAWLVEHGLLPRSERVTARDHDLALALREAIRSALLAHQTGGADAPAPDLERLAAQLPLRLAAPGRGPQVVPAEGGVRGALAGIVAAVARSAAAGTWVRLKVCPADDCRWAFYDESRNRSRTWCAMEVCGNRAKTRTYRSRHGIA
jgi:predicted RNA-binding Zn ribbon-like protein